MGHLLGLPPELLGFIAEDLHGDRTALRALSLVSRAFIQPSQTQLFRRINVRSAQINDYRSLGNVGEMRRRISLESGGAQVLSYTRTLLLSLGQPLVYPQQLDDIFDYLVAFKNVRQLIISLFATHYVNHPLASPARYFAHFQPTLRSLRLSTWLTNPWDLITFLAFFPLLEDVEIEMLDTYGLPPLPESESEGSESTAISPFRGSLRLRRFCHANTFVLELLKSQVQYHTLSFPEMTVWSGIQELIVACAPTLRVLEFFNLTCVSKLCWPLSLNLAACTRLTEISLALISSDSTSLGVEPYINLLSTISSPHLRRITLALNVVRFARRSKFNPEVLACKEWGTADEVFVQLAAKSREVIEVIVLLKAMKPPSSVPECGRFLARFKEVGKVQVGFL